MLKIIKKKTAMSLTKPSSDDKSWFRFSDQGFPEHPSYTLIYLQNCFIFHWTIGIGDKLKPQHIILGCVQNFPVNAYEPTNGILI